MDANTNWLLAFLINQETKCKNRSIHVMKSILHFTV